MKKKLALFLTATLILAIFCFPLTSCTSESIYSEGNGKLNLLCTSFAPFDFAREVGGDRVTVSILQDSGADLHNYTPTAATLDAISKADLLICIGGSSDQNWLPDAIRAAGNDDLITLCLMDSVTPIYAELENNWTREDHTHESDHATTDREDEHSHSHNHDHSGHDHGADEHIWTSVKNAKLMVSAIKDVLIKADPENRSDYEKNCQAYTAKLDNLDVQLENIAENIPIILFADRFPFVYLLHDYHIPYKAAFSGCSTEINAGFGTQVTLIEAVREKQLPSIFIIEGGSKDLADAIAAETGCKIFALDSMQSVKRSDIISGANYIDIMQKNIETLKEAHR